MKRLLILAAIAATACKDSEPPLPPDVLPRETFKEMLVGAHLITATTRARATVGLVLEDLGPGPAFDSLYAAYGTDSATFRATFNAYAERPRDLKAVYEEVLTEIVRRKDEAQGAQ